MTLALNTTAINATNSTNSTADSASAGTFVLGVCIALLGSTGEQLGLSMWKLAENKAQNYGRAHQYSAQNEPPIVQNGAPNQTPKGPDHGDGNATPEVNESEATASAAAPPQTRRIDLLEEGGHARTCSPAWCVSMQVPLRTFAFLIFATGNGLNLVALGMIQSSIVTLLGAWALVINLGTAKVRQHGLYHSRKWRRLLDTVLATALCCTPGECGSRRAPQPHAAMPRHHFVLFCLCACNPFPPPPPQAPPPKCPCRMRQKLCLKRPSGTTAFKLRCSCMQSSTTYAASVCLPGSLSVWLALCLSVSSTCTPSPSPPQSGTHLHTPLGCLTNVAVAGRGGGGGGCSSFSARSCLCWMGVQCCC